jgi:hypothetical protein
MTVSNALPFSGLFAVNRTRILLVVSLAITYVQFLRV